jgi:hypothetical protein
MSEPFDMQPGTYISALFYIYVPLASRERFHITGNKMANLYIPEPEPVTKQAFRQLSEITNTYTNASEVGLVLAATEREDLHWLLNYCREQYGRPAMIPYQSMLTK